MNFKTWLESELINTKDISIRDAKPSEIPQLFIHRTDNPQDIKSIARNGFNLRFFGKTSRKYKSPTFLTQYDPRGIYALPYKD
jgi:hypothetical protein